MNDKDFEIQRWAAVALTMLVDLADYYRTHVSEDFQWYYDAARAMIHHGKINYDLLRRLVIRFQEARMSYAS